MGEVDPDRFIFIDESNAKTTMTRRYGRAPRGERVVDHVPAGQYHSTSVPVLTPESAPVDPKVATTDAAGSSMMFAGRLAALGLAAGLWGGERAIKDRKRRSGSLGLGEQPARWRPAR